MGEQSTGHPQKLGLEVEMQIAVDKVFPAGISGGKQWVCDLIRRETCLSVLKTKHLPPVSVSASPSRDVFSSGASSQALSLAKLLWKILSH